ncbi:MAG: retropepsin-like aspartic protease [Bacteroidota bacterium]|jgi:hypothetical protein
MRLPLLFIGILLFVSVASAQETPVQPLTRIPFLSLTGGVMIVTAQMPPFPDTLQFIFDTGSSGISLDSSTASYLGLQPVYSGYAIRGVGGIRKVPFVNGRSLQLGSIRADSLDFHVNDYSVLTSVYGVRIDGIIGYSLLSRYVIRIDQELQQMDWFAAGVNVYPRRGYRMKLEIDKLPSHAAYVQDVRGEQSRFLIDLGAGLNLLFSRRYVQSSGLLDNTRKRWIKSGEGIGGRIEMELTTMRQLRIGPYRFRQVPINIFDDDFNVTNYPEWAGLIGNDLLRRFQVILNYPDKGMHLLPNRYFSDPFDYSYSGLELYLVANKIRVGYLAPGSPAAAAGLELGDEVVAVNMNFSGILTEYKFQLQKAGERVRIIYRRDEKIGELEFRVLRIR